MKHLFVVLTAATLANTLVQADSTISSKDKNQTSQQTRPEDDKYGNFHQGFFVTADFLYWIAHEEGLEYASTGEFGDTNNANVISVTQGSDKNVHFKWKPGFRLGAGWTLPDSYWDLSVNWTWYHSDAKGSASHKGDDINLDPLWGSLAPASFADVVPTPLTLDKISAKWRLHYNTLDFELGRSFYPNRYLSVRPHTGVRAAWVNQRFSLLYNLHEQNESGSFFEFSVIKSKFRNNYHAAGFKTGLDTLWSFNRVWGIFANGSISLLGGNFHLKEGYTLTSITAQTGSFSGNYKFINTKDRFFSIIPVFEAAMGVHCTLRPERKHYWINLGAGWEYLLWLNQNQLRIFTSNNNKGLFIRERGNLHLMGFTVHAKLRF